MARLLVALASLAAMTASFLAVSAVLDGEPAHAPAAPQEHAAPPTAPLPSAPDAPPQPAAGVDLEALRAEAARAAERREEAMRASILALSESEGTTIDYKLDRYRDTLREAFEGTAKAHVLEDRGTLTEAFLRMESVQEDLAALSPAVRAQELVRIRQEMGYDEEEIARLAARDASRESRWQRGLAYMAERRRLEQTFEGEALEEELEALRERTFAHEASTIAREEADGFFRYERRRIYGRN